MARKKRGVSAFLAAALLFSLLSTALVGLKVSGEDLNEKIGEVLKYNLSFNENVKQLEKDVYAWDGFTDYKARASQLSIRPGDVLSYDFYIPEDSDYAAGIGVVRLQTTDGKVYTNINDTLVDQNGVDWVWHSCVGGVRLPGHINGFHTAIPKYLQDHDKYFGNADSPTMPNEAHYCWLPEGEHKADIEYMWQCERDAVSALFQYLAENDTTHRSILFQLNNEPNSHIDWDLRKTDIFYPYLNALGEVVKKSNYKVATRVNLLQSDTPLMDMVDINQLEYVDFVGMDPYTTSVETIKSLIRRSSCRTRRDSSYTPPPDFLKMVFVVLH